MTADGRFLLSWIEPGESGGHALRFSTRLPGEGWSPPRTVARGTSWFVNWADFPRVAAADDGTLFAHWLEKHPKGGPYQYDVRIVRSVDGGATWSRPALPYRDATPAEHGFVSLAPVPGGVGVLFLDGRETARARGAMTLRFASWAREGDPAPDALVDPRVCDCCQTAAARTARGLVVAYRDRSETEVRDVAVRRLEGGAWSEPVYPGDEGWTIAGCPVNGPALAAEGERVALAWYTMAGEKPAVRAALSRDSGISWSRAVTLDHAEPLGRVDVVLTERGALASWLAASPGGAEIRAASLGDDGAPGRPSLVARTSAARASGFPQLERTGGEIVAAWTEPGDPAAVRTATLEVRE
ncbi:MAG TPA: sialidase family protein [Vicinamibacteria bacterium]